MSLSRASLQERQLKAIRRAQFRLTQTLERLSWEEEVLFPEVEKLKAGKAVLGLQDGTAFEVVIEDADHHSSSKEPNAADRGAGRRESLAPRRARKAAARPRLRH